MSNRNFDRLYWHDEAARARYALAEYRHHLKSEGLTHAERDFLERGVKDQQARLELASRRMQEVHR